MLLLNSMAMIGRAECWKFVKTGLLDPQVAASEEAVVVTVVAEEGLVVVAEAASGLAVALAVATAVVEGIVVAPMAVPLRVDPSMLVHLLRAPHHPTHSPTTPRPEENQASSSTFAT